EKVDNIVVLADTAVEGNAGAEVPMLQAGQGQGLPGARRRHEYAALVLVIERKLAKIERPLQVTGREADGQVRVVRIGETLVIVDRRIEARRLQPRTPGLIRKEHR